MTIPPKPILLEMDSQDRINIANLVRRSTQSRSITYPGDLVDFENLEIGMCGEQAVLKWLKSHKFEVTSRTFDNPFEMKSDLLIRLNTGEQIGIEVKTSQSSHEKLLLKPGQMERIKTNSVFIVLCVAYFYQKHLKVEIEGYVSTQEIPDFREKLVGKQDGSVSPTVQIDVSKMRPAEELLEEIEVLGAISKKR
jgi:hypothetical protein